MSNGWSRDAHMKNKKQADAGELNGDEFTKLLSTAPGPKAKVSYGYSEGLEFGSYKVSVTISLECDQREDVLNKAGELAYKKARELVDDGWSLLQREGKVQG